MDIVNYGKIKKLQGKVKDTQAKIIDVERNVSDLSNAISNLNPNQEAKQSVSGYGILSLPQNAANSPVSLVVKGNTVDNKLGSDGQAERVFPVSVSTNTAIKTGMSLPAGKYLVFYEITQTTATSLRNTVRIEYTDSTTVYERAAENYNTTIGRKLWKLTATQAIKEFRYWVNTPSTEVKVKNFMVVSVDDTEYAKTEAELLSKYNYINGAKSTLSGKVQIKDGETVKGEAYYNGILRSVGTANDEVSITDGNKTQKVGYKENVASGTVINYADMATGGQFVAYAADGTQQIGVKGDTLTITATGLSYQLQTPIITEIPAQLLTAGPGHTVMWLPEIPDAGVYSNGITILNPDLPIKSLKKIAKIDFMTGAETKLDVATAVIAADKKSFTHPGLSNDDIVFFEYEYLPELTTTPEMVVGYLDSRYVVEDTANGKLYSWKITSTNGVASIVLTEVQ